MTRSRSRPSTARSSWGSTSWTLRTCTAPSATRSSLERPSATAPQTSRRAHKVYPITALQTEYSRWSRDVEQEILPTVRELGIGFVAYSPLGRGFLSGQFRKPEDIPADDWRRNSPRFQGEN